MSEAADGVAVVILAAGRGSRMGGPVPKPLLPVGGHPMLNHVLDTANGLAGSRIVVVTAPGADAVAALAHPHAVAEQAERNGTAGAVKAAHPLLRSARAVIVLFSDCPLITTATLARMVAAWRGPPEAEMVVLTYAEGNRWVDSGFMMVDTRHLWDWLDRVPADPHGEYSLNALPPLAEAEGARIVRLPCDVTQLLGANTAAELAHLETLIAAPKPPGN